MNQLLYLDAEQEGVFTVLALSEMQQQPPSQPALPTVLPSATQTNYPLLPEGALLSYLHQQTQISLDSLPRWGEGDSLPTPDDTYNFPFCLKVAMATQPIPWGDHLGDLEQTILKRRSTRAYNGLSLTLEELQSLLDFTYQPQHYQAQGLNPEPDYCDLNLIQTFLAVSAVTGLDAGCYYYAPQAQELRQIRFKNFRQDLYYLCLGQELGRDAGVVLFHTADLSAAVTQYGDRAYRYLHLDAGHLGQRLNLAALHLGLGVSGIGGFFDNQVNEVLGIPVDEAVLYITTLGRPR